jgi:hypothetical protein
MTVWDRNFFPVLGLARQALCYLSYIPSFRMDTMVFISKRKKLGRVLGDLPKIIDGRIQMQIQISLTSKSNSKVLYIYSMPLPSRKM